MGESGLTAKLTDKERETLASLSETIRKGQQTFIDVGTALLRIRDERLYREGAENFEAFCQVEYGFTRQRASQLIIAAEVAGEVSTVVDNNTPSSHPMTERQARELAKVPKGERAKVLKEAVETAPKDDKGKPKVTAQHVSQVVAKRRAPEPAPEPTPTPDTPPETQDAGGTESEVVASTTVVDERKPDKGEPWAAFNAEIGGILTDLRSASARLGKVLNVNAKEKKIREPWGYFYSYGGTHGELLTLIRNLEDGMPAAATDKNAQGFIPAWKVADAERNAKARKAG